nr:hypothetical protein [Gordonia sp. NB41Y]
MTSATWISPTYGRPRGALGIGEAAGHRPSTPVQTVVSDVRHATWDRGRECGGVEGGMAAIDVLRVGVSDPAGDEPPADLV